VVVSFVMTSWRTKIRRAMNERDTATRGIVADVLMGWETVKVSQVYREGFHEAVD
jgi:ABC-type transport system involved in Fe-S cluster assembly fused permease/ATPase subunit